MTAHPLRIIFAGTPEFSVAPLQTLLNSPHQVVAVYTQPDRPAGRGQKLTASPVKQLALAHALPIYQPQNLKDPETQQTLANLNADLMIVVAYGLILPQVVLDTPKYGCFNIHASLLPRWRGAAPIQRAIEQGDAETGITMMQMDKGLDTGDMLTQLRTPINAEDTAQTLHDRLSLLGCDAMMQTLNDLQANCLTATPQSAENVTYAEKLNKAEAQIDWQQNAQQIARKIQAFNPWPVAFCQINQQPLRIWQAKAVDTLPEKANPNSPSKQPGLVLWVDKSGLFVQTGEGILCIQTLQPAGKKAMPAYDFAQSRNLVGSQLD